MFLRFQHNGILIALIIASKDGLKLQNRKQKKVPSVQLLDNIECESLGASKHAKPFQMAGS